MNQTKTTRGGYQSRICASIRRQMWWSGAWLATTALMKFGPRLLWHRAGAVTLLAAGLNAAAGVGLILAVKKYVMTLDELQRSVYLNALGITVGVVLVVGVPYRVLDLYGLFPFRADYTTLVELMTATFLLSYFHGAWRYR